MNNLTPSQKKERGLRKKIRLSKDKGQEEKAKGFEQDLQHFLKCQAINARNKKLKQKKKNKNNLTDDMFMDQCQKENEKRSKDKEELIQKETEQKKKSIENKVKRAKILQAKKEKEEQKQKNMIQLKLDRDNYKKKEGELNKRLESHEVFMKEETPDELKKLYDKVMGEINNKKLANRTYKKQLKQRSMMIEVAIQGYMDQHKVSYEEAQEVLYDILRKKLVSKSKPLMIDGIAKL